ncbi:DUF2782 domain-containing protein [Candidatus Thiosymbion oneisti]|uniref:DUF2782 domain-containing protein n=1 Tax=Candidatus Thiosymbion oneisti TaxID=589554 RepID=UPI00105EDD82|nr:DUF2782 domain-containing protein [Candidatus Thiosymbion oneisti]
MKRLILTAASIATAALPAAVHSGTEPKAYPEPPELPPPAYQGETVEPQVTIIETGQDTIYEYRVRGRLYMVKVQPQIGPPYYLLDTTGDGQLDARRDRVWNNALPQWVLFSW